MWSQIILASRTWARLVWIHCEYRSNLQTDIGAQLISGPDTMTATPFEAEQEKEKALDECRAILEKKTMVQMALAFAVAVKHYLRGEEGMYVLTPDILMSLIVADDQFLRRHV